MSALSRMPPLPPLTETETELMKVLWKLGQGTVPTLVETLNQRQGREPITRGTVQVLLNRIDAKGWVKRQKNGRAYTYEPRTTEDQGLAEMAGAFQSKVFDGSALQLVQTLVQSSKLKSSDIQELRSLLDDAEKNLTDKTNAKKK